MAEDIKTWAGQKAEQSNEHDRLQQFQREWTLHTERMFRAKAPNLLRSLWSLVEVAMSEANGKWAENPQRITQFNWVPSDGFLVRRPRYPSVDLEVRLDLDSRCIRFTTTTRLDYESPLQHTTGRLRILLSDTGEVQLADEHRYMDLDDACKSLLKPFF